MRSDILRSGRLACIALLALVALACTPAAPPAASGAAPGGSSAAAPPPQRVKVAYVTLASNTLPAWLAQDEGLFAKYGLDVELIYISGAAKVAEALLAGDIQVAVAPPASAFGPSLEGADLVLVASWANRITFSLHATPAIQSVADLRGARLAVTRRGSDSERWARSVLARYGLEADRDYTLLAAGGQMEGLAGLQNGAFDGVMLGPPVTIIARQNGFPALLSYRDFAIESANVGLVTNRRYLRDHPDAIEAMLRACAEGIAIYMQQRDKALASLAKWGDTTDRDVLDETLDFQQERTTREMLPTPASLRSALDEFVSLNPKAATANPEDFVDLTIVKQLNDSGYIRGLYPQ